MPNLRDVNVPRNELSPSDVASSGAYLPLDVAMCFDFFLKKSLKFVALSQMLHPLEVAICFDFFKKKSLEFVALFYKCFTL